jgi:YD repeat-containing protein
MLVNVLTACERNVRRRGIVLMKLRLVAYLIMAFAVAVSSWAGEAQFAYDELGRLTTVVDEAGNTAIYNYDAVGNLLSIDRYTAPGFGIGIYTMVPGKGAVGAQVKIQGYGFSTTTGNNTVTFNGTAATVVSSTTYTITATVPSGATTGTVSVTNSNGTGNSPQAFTVLAAPTVTSVDPAQVPPGAISGVQVSGTNLAEASAVQFTQAGLVATLLSGGTASTLPIRLNVASTVPAGSYTFTVKTPGGQVASGTVTITVAATAKPTYSTGPLVSVAMPLNASVPPTGAPAGWTIMVAPGTSGLTPYPDAPATQAPAGWSITVAPPTSGSMP